MATSGDFVASREPGEVVRRHLCRLAGEVDGIELSAETAALIPASS
jgi:hypothetical protein